MSAEEAVRAGEGLTWHHDDLSVPGEIQDLVSILHPRQQLHPEEHARSRRVPLRQPRQMLLYNTRSLLRTIGVALSTSIFPSRYAFDSETLSATVGAEGKPIRYGIPRPSRICICPVGWKPVTLSISILDPPPGAVPSC